MNAKILIIVKNAMRSINYLMDMNLLKLKILSINLKKKKFIIPLFAMDVK